jgi:hypothetical protein
MSNPIICRSGRKSDGLVKEPDAALRFISRHCGVRCRDCSPNNPKLTARSANTPYSYSFDLRALPAASRALQGILQGRLRIDKCLICF